MSDFVRRARALFAVDLRALAALRIGLGVCVLADVAQRATSLRAHYTDAGVLSRADVVQLFSWLHEWGLSVHLLGGSALAQGLLFTLHAAAGLALLVGFRTTLAVAVAWLLTSSVQLRNLYIGGGFDALLRMLLFWGMFLPLGARASVDQQLRGTTPAATPHLSVGSVALLLQVAIVYFAAGVAKAEHEAWRSGEALAYVLHDEFFTTGFGAWLGGLPAVCHALTWSVLAAEIAGPVLLFALAPAPWARVAVVAVLLAMNAGFGLALAVGPFPWVVSLGLLAFVPGVAWDRLQPVSAPLRRRWHDALVALAGRLRAVAGAPATAPRHNTRALAQGACAVVLAYVLFWNVGVARDPEFRPPDGVRWLGHSLFLQQSWRMFAAPSTVTGWIVVRGELVDGSEVDLLAAGGPAPGDEAIRAVSWERPDDIVGAIADIRWRLLLRRTSGGDDAQLSPLNYGRYLCREWNGRHEDGRQLASFAIVRIVKTLEPPFAAAEYRREPVWTHDCFG